MLSNSGKTLLILYDETVVKLRLKAMHKVNTSNSSRQVVSMALNAESTTQYLDYSYWMKACFFFLSALDYAVMGFCVYGTAVPHQVNADWWV